MTLDISQFIANTIRTQSKIHHLDINVKAVKADAIPASVVKLIKKDYGDKYLDDADYVAFFWGGIGKEQIEKLFNVVDKALGKSANKLTDKDFKKIYMDGDDEEAVANEETEEVEVDDEDIPDDEEETSDDDSSEQLNEDDEDDSSVDDDNNDTNNDTEEVEEVKVEEEKIPLAHFFLKITTK